MSVYLGYNEVTKQYLKSLGRGGTITVSDSGGDLSASGFTMSGDINMSGNEVIGFDDPSSDSSAANKKYVDDEVAKITTSGGLDQTTADGRYLRKTEASSTYETKTDAFNTYLSKTDASSTYAPVDASYTKSESDNKYSLKGSGGGGGGLSASGFAMTEDIDMGNNKILKLADPITPKSATNKEYVENNFLSKHGGLILGSIDMSGQSITNVNSVPQSFGDVVTKKYVDDSIGLAGGLSITGLTMQGDINMSGHNVTGLDDPTNDDMAASKGYVDSNFLDLAGGTMVGDIDMGGYEIKNMLRTPTTDLSAVTKKWVSDEFPTKQEVLGGFTLTGALNLSGNEIYGLRILPLRITLRLVKSTWIVRLREGAVRPVDFPILDSRYQADARYVEKAKLTLGEWMDTFDEVNFVNYNWSKHIKKSTITSESNIEIRVASFVTDMSISQLLKHKLIIGIRYVDSSSTVAKHLVTIPLTGKSFSKLSYGASGSSGDYGYMYSFHIHNGEYIGNDADAIGSYLWQVGAKFEATKSHTLLDTSAHISFALNEAGQLG